MNNVSKRGVKIFTLVLAVIIAAALIPAAIATVGDANMNDNAAPVARNLEYATYRGVAVTGTLQAIDPEGDMIEYKLINEPKKGTATVSEDGQFTYKPGNGKKGKDSFTYVAVDAVGNVSEEATVKIIIEKQSSKIVYYDMEGHSAHYAALKLAEEDIFVGERIGNCCFFNPDLPVCRGEFLAMCLNASGEEILEDITRSGFADDEEISMWLKPYVTTALLNGSIKGIRSDEGGLVFAADEPITVAQAAVILNKVLGISNVTDSEEAMEISLLVPTWAYQATINLSALDIIDAAMLDNYDCIMTRAEAAHMLCNAIGTMEEEGGSSLLSWAQ